VEPALDDHCNLWVGDEVKQVGGDDEGGEGVLRVVTVPHILLLLSFEGEEQARHTSGYQTLVGGVWSKKVILLLFLNLKC